ncbi:Gucy2g_4 [Blepharisma stoltei]|uniref:Receptor ligand binding region domain-containing protein n=1 Tax=Blepharisma stoltei TaxID=1481888 RepID=A0AAU9J8N7_9CILI|nr:unnamed protein product [Blepharisma stoltei]
MILEYKNGYMNSNNFDSLLLKQLFESKTSEHRKLPLFSIVNIENNSKIIKALIDGLNAKVFNNTFFYPGNTNTPPIISETEIVVSIASGSKEPNGLPNNVYNSENFEGSLYAQWVINNSTFILKNFYITQFQTDCGSDTFDFNFYYNCMNPYKDQLGVAFLSPSFEYGALGYILVLRSLGLEIPHCGAATSISELSNKTEYREFMRITSSPYDYATIVAKSITYFGWNNIAVIYSNDSTMASLYKVFVEDCTRLDISILNNEDKRIISPGYLRSNFRQFKHIFQNIYDSKARICIMLMDVQSSLHAVEGLYDIGFREGDIVLIFKSKIGGAKASFNDLPEFVHKRKELLLGSLSFSSIEYYGDYGEKIEAEIAKAFYPEDPSYKCFSFDAFMLAANGLDYTINQGGEIENPWLLNKNLRKQRFVGCSGVISINSNSNDRNSAPKPLMNFYYNETDKTYYEEIAMIFNLESSKTLSVLQQIIWPGGSYEIPKDLRDDNFDCPFDKKLVSRSGKGIGLLFGIYFSIFSASGFMTFFVWQRWKLIDFPKLKKQKKIKFADMMVYLVIAIDFFQYLYLGPPISINPLVAYISETTSVDLSNIISFKGSFFWIVMILALSLASLSIFLNILTVTRFKYYLETKYFADIKALAEGLMPILGNALFIPIFSFLLNIFACTHTTGHNIFDTYLDHDCYQYCWQGKHLIFAIFSIVAIFVYVPLIVYYRPLYQEVQESLNIKTMPKYLVVKSFAQIFFVVLKKTLGLYQLKIHGFIYLVLFSIYIWIIIRIKPYNYEKISLFLLVSLLMVDWSVLWTSIANVFEMTIIPWLCCQLIGWAAILVLGTLKSNKIPSLILAGEGIDVSILFKFMVGQVEASQIDKKEIKFVSKKEIGNPWKNILAQDEEKLELKVEDDPSQVKISNSIDYENDALKKDETARIATARKFI